ncbi:MAG TPA: ATP-binding protein [Ktedonosporobacter sp.]|jgi:PAS domain S-box-containing protein|nr:ATP-binding protein [Ktedonosporobacter sp.]
MTAHTNLSFVYDRQPTQNEVAIEAESQELVNVLQKIVKNAGALLEVKSCSIALLDATGTVLVTMAALQKNGHKPRRTRFQLNEGVAGWVAEHREMLVINDVSLDPRFKRLGRVPVGSIMCVPLINNSSFIGTLTASSQDVNAFDERKTQMLTIFADQAILAIVNARNADLALQQANQLEMLIHLSRGITTRLEPDVLYRTILSDARHLVPCELALIYLYHAGMQELYPVAEWSSASAQDRAMGERMAEVKTSELGREKISLYNQEEVTAWAAIHRHPILRSPGQEGPVEKNKSPHPSQVAELAVPFISKDALYGVLLLKRARPFTSEELRLMRNLSCMAAAALENVELFHKVRTDQEQLRAILASSSDGIALLGDNACFIEVNPAFGRIFGIEPARVVGMECMELFGCYNEDGPQCCQQMCMIRTALQQEQPQPYIEIDLRVQGAARSIGMSITPVSTASKPLCLLVARDVTAIRDATRMKANFLSMITHELRSPLNAINGYLDLALNGVAGELSESQREFILRARAGSEHLYALVEDLLIVSRADTGQLRLSREIVSLPDIVTNAVEEMELSAIDNGVTINVDVARDFPRLYADAMRLQQVLRNLLSNALRHTPAGGQVTVAASVENVTQQQQIEEHFDEIERVARLQVSDTGSGITPEHQQHIFERFYRIPGTRSDHAGGQGLGLAIVKMIVELHGGSVQVESTPGRGSTFTCILPCLLS